MPIFDLNYAGPNISPSSGAGAANALVNAAEATNTVLDSAGQTIDKEIARQQGIITTRQNRTTDDDLFAMLSTEQANRSALDDFDTALFERPDFTGFNSKTGRAEFLSGDELLENLTGTDSEKEAKAKVILKQQQDLIKQRKDLGEKTNTDARLMQLIDNALDKNPNLTYEQRVAKRKEFMGNFGRSNQLDQDAIDIANKEAEIEAMGAKEKADTQFEQAQRVHTKAFKPLNDIRSQFTGKDANTVIRDWANKNFVDDEGNPTFDEGHLTEFANKLQSVLGQYTTSRNGLTGKETAFKGEFADVGKIPTGEMAGLILHNISVSPEGILPWDEANFKGQVAENIKTSVPAWLKVIRAEQASQAGLDRLELSTIDSKTAANLKANTKRGKILSKERTKATRPSATEVYGKKVRGEI